jgi:hypothetical protein
MRRERLYIVEDKRFDQAKERCLMIIRNHFGNASWLDSVFEHNDNPDGLSYLDYMFKQFMGSFYHNPDYRKKGVMRLAPLFCRLAFEANFQNSNPNDEVLSRLHQMLTYIYNMSISGNLDVSKISLDATYNDMEITFGKAIDELSKQEDERINSTEYEKNNSYQMLGPLSFEEASYYGDMSCPDSLLCYTQDEKIWDNNYSKHGRNDCYLFLKDGWEDLEPVHDNGRSAYDTYGLSMIFIFVRNGKLVYCNTRWNHEADYANGCECDHALTKEMLSGVIGINFNELFKEEDINERVERLLSQGVNFKKIFDSVSNYSNFSIVNIDGYGYNYLVNGHILSKDWFDYVCPFIGGYGKVNIRDKGSNFIGFDGLYVSDIWYSKASHFSEGLCAVYLDDKGWNYINTEGKLISNFSETFDFKVSETYDFKNGYARIVNEYGGSNFINKNCTLISDIWFTKASDFSIDGIACVYRAYEDGWNYINTEGNIILKNYQKHVQSFKNGYGIITNDEGLQTYVDINGNFIINEWFVRCNDMNEYGIGLVIRIDPNGNENMFKQNRKNKHRPIYTGKYNFINVNGEYICEPFDKYNQFSEGYASVYYKDKGLWTFINTKGEFFDDNEGYSWFLDVGSFKHGYAPVMIAEDEWIYIDYNGNSINDERYSYAEDFNEYGLGQVEDINGFYNFVRTDGTLFTDKWFIDLNDINSTGIYVYDGMYKRYDFDGNFEYIDDDDDDEIDESIKPKKQLIRMTESDFYNIIKESVKNIITKMIL